MEEKTKKQITERIKNLQQELQMHQSRANQAQQILNTENQQLISKQGAVLELQRLIKEKEEIKEKPKPEKIEEIKKK